MHPEAKDSGLVPKLRFGRNDGRIDLANHITERGAEVGTVDDGMARRLGIVDVFAARTVEFDRGSVGDVGLAHGEERLGFTHDAGTSSEVAFLEFLELEGISRYGGGWSMHWYHSGQTPSRHNVPRMDQAV